MVSLLTCKVRAMPRCEIRSVSAASIAACFVAVIARLRVSKVKVLLQDLQRPRGVPLRL